LPGCNLRKDRVKDIEEPLQGLPLKAGDPQLVGEAKRPTVGHPHPPPSQGGCNRCPVGMACPKERPLPLLDRKAPPAQLGRQKPPLGCHLAGSAGNHLLKPFHRLDRPRHGQPVDAKRRFCGGNGLRPLLACKQVADPQPGKTVRLREGSKQKQPGVVGKERHPSGRLLGVIEQRLVEEDPAAGRDPGKQPGELPLLKELPGRVVWAGKGDCSGGLSLGGGKQLLDEEIGRPLADGREADCHRRPLHPPLSAKPGEEGVGGPGEEKPLAGVEHKPGSGGKQRACAGADDHLAGGDAVPLRKQRAQTGCAWIALEGGAGGMGERLDDQRVGKLRPVGLGEVELGGPLQLGLLALGGTAGKLGPFLLLGLLLEAAVVVEQARLSPSLSGEEGGAGAVDQQKPDRKGASADHRPGGENPAEGALLLGVAACPAHQHPEAVKPHQPGKGAVEGCGNGGNGGDQAGHHRPAQVVDLGADPQRRDRDRSPEQRAADHLDRQQQAGKGGVKPPPPVRRAGRRPAIAQRPGGGPAADKQAAAVTWVGTCPSTLRHRLLQP